MENTLSEHDRLVIRAMALKEKRRRLSHAGALTFDEWLPVVTPMYQWDWQHLVYIRKELHRITSGEIKKLMIFMPPRHGKTECVTIRYPA